MSHSLQLLQTVQVLPVPVPAVFRSCDLVSPLAFCTVSATLALLCSESTTVRPRPLRSPSCPQKDDSQNKNRDSAYSEPMREFICPRRNIHLLSSSPRDPSQLEQKERCLQWRASLLTEEWCRCRHSTVWQVISLAAYCITRGLFAKFLLSTHSQYRSSSAGFETNGQSQDFFTTAT